MLNRKVRVFLGAAALTVTALVGGVGAAVAADTGVRKFVAPVVTLEKPAQLTTTPTVTTSISATPKPTSTSTGNVRKF